ncbi:DUF3141 domain-containing protein [Azotobacter bryophylli]|uniref:DUF3141 domain-containing protein n=1 Tax=Azotobacter bryophylli TaxID=1986537 RepID=A0ABV7ARE5_9GAMM
MSQEIFFAQQQASVTSFNNLIRHLGGLQKLQTQNLLSSLQQRNDESLEALRASRLRLPDANDWREYLIDAGQRSLLFWDALRQRGDNTLAYERAGFPFLLHFDYEVLLDGSTLSAPVNYSLLRIIPEPGQTTNESLPPVIVIDPRGGHGAGIGGFKEDSEIGESLRAGHPTYFIGFSHWPQPEQTLVDVAAAQAKFIETVIARHPKAGKPVVIGNCQAGWALMSLAAVRPELPGLVIIAGAPLSYWAGVDGRNPMRYSGGLLGGAWMTRLGSDLGNGRFDGAWLVSNFENLNPANTYWTKYYNLFAKVDSETPRFLDFERWWSSPVLFNSEEIEAIVDDLFIGNSLTGVNRRKGGQVDLRKIEAPVVVFCSYGDNITPPQQALDWIVDLYPTDLALHSSGRTIVYLEHASIGHLGIFVSGKVARREYHNLIGVIDAIQALPPGLFELIIDDVPRAGEGAEAYEVHFESRSIADIMREDDGREEEVEFAITDRVSDVNSTLYDLTVRPWLSRLIDEPAAELMRQTNPFRMQRVAWSSLNPALWWLPGTAELARRSRQPARTDNPLLAWQNLFASSIEHAWDTYRDIRDASQEWAFHSIFGWMGALLSGQLPHTARKANRQDPELLERLHECLPQGGPLEASLRILLLLANASGSLDKELLEGIVKDYRRRLSQEPGTPDIATLRKVARQQSLLVFAYPEESLRTLAHLLPDGASRQRVLAQIIPVVPEWHRSDGQLGKVWRELYQALGLPLPAFAQPLPAANDAAMAIEEEKASATEPEAPAQPEAKAAAEPEAPTQPEAKAVAEPEAPAQPEAKAAAEPKAPAQPEAKAAVEPEAPTQPEAKAAVEPEAPTQPEAKVAAEPEAPTQPEAQTVAAPEAPAQPETKAAAPEAPTQLELAAPAQPETKSQTEPAPAQPAVKAAAETAAVTQPEMQVVAEPQVESRAEPAAPEATAQAAAATPASPKKPAKPRVRVRAKAEPSATQSTAAPAKPRAPRKPRKPAPDKPE